MNEHGSIESSDGRRRPVGDLLFRAETPCPDVLLRTTDPIEVPAGTVLFRQGQRIHTLHIVETGIVALTIRRRKRDVFVAFRSSGAVLGAASAFLDEVQHVTAETLSTCRLRSLAHRDIRKLCATDDGWLCRTLAREILDLLDHLGQTVACSARDRMAVVLRELLRLAGERQSDFSYRLKLPITVQQLALCVASTREQASRVLAELAAAHIIQRDKQGWLVAPRGSPLLKERGERD